MMNLIETVWFVNSITMVYWGSKEKMVSSFTDFDFVIQNLKRQKKMFGFDFGKDCSADRNKIFV